MPPTSMTERARRDCHVRCDVQPSLRPRSDSGAPGRDPVDSHQPLSVCAVHVFDRALPQPRDRRDAAPSGLIGPRTHALATPVVIEPCRKGIRTMRLSALSLLLTALLCCQVLPPPAHGFDELGEPTLSAGQDIL